MSTATTAVVSLFDADERVKANIAALLDQVAHVIVVDDGSPHNPEPILRELAGMGCIVKRLPKNSGIATALNTGISLALAAADKPEYILTMDQDSLLDSGYVAALVRAAALGARAGLRVGMIAPASVRGLPTRRGEVVNGVQLGGEPIQSGLLIPTSVIEEIGLFQGDLFIDGVDTEYYLRCVSSGFSAVIAPEAELHHSLGTMTQARIMGANLAFGKRPLEVRTAASWRYYYLFRNRILLANKYGRKHLWLVVRGFLADYRHLAIVTLLAPDRRSRITAAAAGVADGIRGVSGKRPSVGVSRLRD